MNEAILSQHPAVVLRSTYQNVRALLAVAMIAVVGLTAAVVILATHNGGGSSAATPARVSSPATPATSQAGATLDHRGLNVTAGTTTRYDGGPEEGTRGAFSAPSSQSQTPYSYNGGHEEGNALR
jgi:hypothetical protein